MRVLIYHLVKRYHKYEKTNMYSTKALNKYKSIYVYTCAVYVTWEQHVHVQH